ncbi:hypothetical protein ADIS_0421 [Lunatimonas lonarensis]|uniref:Uncharacterized protein n=1 Tax=Lunatimonas lonarensis TaxID=1232681 RepID=R7ZYF0_9BACT|nr:hypothetical protein ADIS_0421 [Lunatimonas lonarensis]
MQLPRLRLKLSWTKPGACLWAFMFPFLGHFCGLVTKTSA